MSEYFPEPKSLEGKGKIELDLSNYTAKVDFKNATAVDTSKFAKKVNLANLKSNVDKLDIDKLKNVPSALSSLKSKVDELDVDKLVPVSVDLSKPSDVVKNDKIPDITKLTTKTTLNAKVNEVKRQISNYLATTAAVKAKINQV